MLQLTTELFGSEDDELSRSSDPQEQMAVLLDFFQYSWPSPPSAGQTRPMISPRSSPTRASTARGSMTSTRRRTT